MSKQLTAIAAALLLGAGVGGAVGAAVALESDSEPAAQPAAANLPVSQTTSSTAALYKRYKDAVVEVHASTGGSSDSPFEGQTPGEATGSGFVIDKEGHIVTNQHVVDNAQSVRVEFSDGTDVDAEIVGTDPSTDVAVLDVDRPESRPSTPHRNLMVSEILCAALRELAPSYPPPIKKLSGLKVR